MRHAAFAEFYHFHGRDGYVCAVGDRSVLLLDGRWSITTQHMHAQEWARKHGYAGYRLARGEFINPFYLTACVQKVT